MTPIPSHFTIYREAGPSLSNREKTINKEIALAIKGKPFYSEYSAWHFHDIVWWDDDVNMWRCDVSCFKEKVNFFAADTLEEIIIDVSEKYGWQ